MRSMISKFRSMAVVALVTGATAASAFQVLPKVSDVDRKLGSLGENWLMDTAGQWFVRGGLHFKKKAVHEAVTLAAFGCNATRGDEMDCLTKEHVLKHRMVLYGVRWPDDPPFRLSAANPPQVSDCDVRITLRATSQPKCWLTLFFDAEKRAAAYKGEGTPFGVGDMLLYRSHFGDLQFMHALASRNGEPAAATSEQMKTWAHFLWEMAGHRLPTDVYLRDLPGQRLAQWFPGEMTAQNLFATGLIEPRPHLDEVAFGALLHMVQDSFSAAHAHRADEGGARCSTYPSAPAPGKLLSFHSYVHQKSALHDVQDTAESMGIHSAEAAPSAVDASRVLIAAWMSKKAWAEIEPYIDCLLTLNAADAEAGPGPFR